MIRIIDTLSQIDSLFDNKKFNNEKWEIYINSIYDKSSDLFKNDLKEYLESGNFSYENDILPIIDAVYENESLQALKNSFYKVTDCLNERIKDCFEHEVDVDIVLYLGLCNGAGWVTNINGQDVILLGIEKILELNWCDKHFGEILRDFYSDLPSMTRFNQRYFGDWVNYGGRCDVGYYLGAKFVHHLCNKFFFEQLIKLSIDEIYEEFLIFYKKENIALT